MYVWSVGYRVVRRDGACISSSALNVLLTVIAVDDVGISGRIKDSDCRFKEYRPGWERRVQYWEKEVCRLVCKGKDDERRNEDGIRIDLRGEIFINGVEVVEEGVAPSDMYLNSILK